ncbi:MAG: hypothetical protein HYY39_04450 [Armatimonadetes bacterium]|nr:hypothetical protein [Armatimonadota bacterium]
MERELTQRLTIVRLIEAYGGLLTARQRHLLRLYYLDDLSLGEIAAQLKVTRQAIFDSVRRSVEELNRLEGSLRLLATADQASRHKAQIASRLEALDRSVARLAGKIDEKILNEISDEIIALRRACL